MFSGIVEELAHVASCSFDVDPSQLIIESALDHSRSELGHSIAIDGVCLTLVEKTAKNGRFFLRFELAAETVRRSTLGKLSAGIGVNLERSMILGERLHGHLVFGHVDAVSTLLSRERDGNCDRLVWQIPRGLAAFFVEKGSVSLSGVSLTVGEVTREHFSVYIIPHTAEVTSLSSLQVGDSANIEVDMLARYLHRFRELEQDAR
jgi:riboflavin synthase